MSTISDLPIFLEVLHTYLRYSTVDPVTEIDAG